MFRSVCSILGLLGCVSALALPAAAQGDGPLVVRNDTAAAAAGNFWTPARLRSAKPLDLPRGGGGATTAAIRMAGGTSESSAAGLPTYKGPPLDVRLTEALSVLEAAEGGVAPAAVGTSALRFTNERVVPMSVLRNTYPWKAVGKLFFTGATGGSFVCSASVVRNRVIATAGHCVYDTVVNRFHSNFFFVPGFDNGASPYGGFSWSLASTTGSWAAGNGSVPNAADFGVIVAANKVVSAQVRRIGDLTGWLGWKTNALVGNNISAMGYPCNLDSCQILQRTSAHVLRTRAPNSAEIGSDHRGGASGGPWAQDFGVAAAGQPARELNGNILVGITSYGPISLTERYLGSSILNAEWVAIWNIACGQPGACA
jgi:hypothetical protein